MLITLGIIGIVAALTMPTLVNSTRKKELEAGLRKHYALISQALLQYETDNGAPIKSTDYATYSFKPIFMQYFKGAKDCGNSACAPCNSTSCYYKTFNGNSAANGSNHIDEGQFLTADGALYMFDDGNPSLLYIVVDVNGPNKGPNKFGYDVFEFILTSDGKLLPEGADGSNMTDRATYCSAQSTNYCNGLGCTSAALSDENYWKNLP